jgi:Fe(3+) dicitrate transport protein
LFANGSLLDAEIGNSLNTSRTGLLFDSEKWNAALTATIVGEQYWQDSNLARGSGATEVAAKIPGYEVLD